MKSRLICLLTVIGIMLTSCGQPVSDQSGTGAGSTWQEQYDLGMRYLTEGNYAEAIIAFTAAIEIDPKQPEAYIGRGDAHSGVARLAVEDAGELSGEAIDSYESAVDDYLAAIGLDAQMTETYLKAAEVYIALGDIDAAVDILSKGYVATGDESLRERMETIKDERERSTTILARGTIIYNPDEYGEIWSHYRELYQDDANDTVRCSIVTYGVRFETPVQVSIGNETAYIQEARFSYDQDLIDSATQLHNYETNSNGSLIGPVLEFQGHFYRNSQTQELEGPIYYEEEDRTYYSYRPNGDFVFQMESYIIP